MKHFLLKYKILLFLLFIAGCSSTQTTMYEPSDGGKGWQINVIKKPGITDEFVCTINGTTVLSDSFPLIGDNISKTGDYKGKKVMMNGFRTSSTTKDANGNMVSNDSYQIRVFIDNKLIDKFDF
ncbi:MAG: hypothetical protein ABI462_15235 [Ignavibacteria bacterium]